MDGKAFNKCSFEESIISKRNYSAIGGTRMHIMIDADNPGKRGASLIMFFNWRDPNKNHQLIKYFYLAVWMKRDEIAKLYRKKNEETENGIEKITVI